MNIKKFTFNPFSENTYILFDETKECVIIDPGCYEESEKKHLIDFIEIEKLKPKLLLNTHCHIDHVFGCKFIFDKFDLKPIIHKDDIPTLRMAASSGSLWGLELENVPNPENFISEKDIIKFGKQELEVFFTPGHAPGHVCFVHHKTKSIINGDVLFQLSIGRTDLPGCNHSDLINSIEKKLFTLPDDYTVYSGHGSETNIGFEKQNNPFLKK